MCKNLQTAKDPLLLSLSLWGFLLRKGSGGNSCVIQGTSATLLYIRQTLLIFILERLPILVQGDSGHSAGRQVIERSCTSESVRVATGRTHVRAHPVRREGTLLIYENDDDDVFFSRAKR